MPYHQLAQQTWSVSRLLQTPANLTECACATLLPVKIVQIYRNLRALLLFRFFYFKGFSIKWVILKLDSGMKFEYDNSSLEFIGMVSEEKGVYLLES